MTDFTFEDATKAGAKARLALAGPSGSGKTYTALTIATAWGGTIGVIDTERGSASKYAKNPATGKGLFNFKRLNMTRYDPRDLPKALAAAAAAGCDTVIIDSLSKFWSGDGGMLEQVDNAAKRSFNGNSFAGWKEARPYESAMIEAMLAFPGHVIVTMRVKTAYEVVENERGRKTPTKIGLAPIQREGIEYEFDVVGDLDLSNTLMISKTRCPELAGRSFLRPGTDVAGIIADWLEDGEPAATALDYRAVALDPRSTVEDIRGAGRAARAAGLLGAAVTDHTGDPMSLDQLLRSAIASAEARELMAAQQDKQAEAPQTDAPPAGADAGPPADSQGTAAPAGSILAAQLATRIADAAEVGDDAELSKIQREIGRAKNNDQLTPQEYSDLAAQAREARKTLAGAK